MNKLSRLILSLCLFFTISANFAIAQFPAKYYHSVRRPDVNSNVMFESSGRANVGPDRVKTQGLRVTYGNTEIEAMYVDTLLSATVPMVLKLPASGSAMSFVVKDLNLNVDAFVIDTTISNNGLVSSQGKPYVRAYSMLTPFLRASAINEASVTLPDGFSWDQGIVSANRAMIVGQEILLDQTGGNYKNFLTGMNEDDNGVKKVLASPERTIIRSRIPTSETFSTLRNLRPSGLLTLQENDTVANNLAFIDAYASNPARTAIVSRARLTQQGKFYLLDDGESYAAADTASSLNTTASLYVSKGIYTRALKVAGEITADELTIINGIEINNATVTGDMTVDGATTLGNVDVHSILSNDASSLFATSGTLIGTLGVVTGGNVNAGGAVNAVTGNFTNMGVNVDATINRDLYVLRHQFLTGNLTVDGNLMVDGTTTLSSNLSVAGNLTVLGGSGNFSNGMTVAQTATFNNTIAATNYRQTQSARYVIGNVPTFTGTTHVKFDLYSGTTMNGSTLRFSASTDGAHFSKFKYWNGTAFVAPTNSTSGISDTHVGRPLIYLFSSDVSNDWNLVYDSADSSDETDDYFVVVSTKPVGGGSWTVSTAFVSRP